MSEPRAVSGSVAGTHLRQEEDAGIRQVWLFLSMYVYIHYSFARCMLLLSHQSLEQEGVFSHEFISALQ